MARFLIRQQEKFVQALGKHNIPGLRWLLEGFNYYDISRVKEVGPDRAAAEWIVRCGGAVKIPADNVKVTNIYAVDASVTGYGCRHFEGLLGIKEVHFIRCDNLHDFGLEYMAKAVGTHLEILEIDGCRRITEFGLAHLELCSGLKSLLLSNLKAVHGKDKVLAKLKAALPNTEIRHPSPI
nr:ATP synthase subunit s, mitochondrial-like [Haemonchus contortus]